MNDQMLLVCKRVALVEVASLSPKLEHREAQRGSFRRRKNLWGAVIVPVRSYGSGSRSSRRVVEAGHVLRAGAMYERAECQQVAEQSPAGPHSAPVSADSVGPASVLVAPHLHDSLP